MTKDVIITIRGLQAGPQTDDEPIEIVVKGEYFYKNNKHYLLYEEVVEGETSVNKNRVKFMPGYMEVHKAGVVNVHMVFEEYKKNITHYCTPYGNIDLGIEAKSVTVEESEDFMEVNVEYALELNLEHIADCDIKITIQPKDSKNFKLNREGCYTDADGVSLVW